MTLQQIDMAGVRNLKPLRICFSPGFNLFSGLNGSGKTSLLEAIHCLGVGRSFRSAQLNNVIGWGNESFTVSGQLNGLKDEAIVRLGVEKHRQKALRIQVHGHEGGAAELAQLLPLQLVNAQSYLLLEAGPEVRRQFIDWGVFHVEPSFLSAWRRFRRILGQRNALLRAVKFGEPVDLGLLQAWDQEFILATMEIDGCRRRYLQRFDQVFQRVAGELLGAARVGFNYVPGWPGCSLDEALQRSRERERAQGTTVVGAHRAELGVTINGRPAKQALSRGQTKVFVFALLVARAQMLKDVLSRQSVLLIDDLTAELDAAACEKLLTHISRLGVQAIVTCIDAETLRQHVGGVLHDAKMFHVEQGQIVTSPSFHVEPEECVAV